MCVRLIRWPIDRIRRKQPKFQHDPLVLIETVGGRQLVAVACDRALAAGVRSGMTLSEARALCAGLQQLPHEPQEDRRAMQSLGRWFMRFSPFVSLAADGLLLDTSGCEQLYGGMHCLLTRVKGALAGLRIHARLAIAPTPAAAWAVASYGKQEIVSSDQLVGTLAPLPPAALQLDAHLLATLRQLGIETIEQLMMLPRKALPARFGAQLLQRIDAAIGKVHEQLVPIAYHDKIEAQIEFEGEIGSLEAVLEAFRHALSQIIVQLIEQGSGARLLHIEFKRMYLAPIVKTIRLSRPSRSPSILFNLLRCTFETVQSDDGFVAIALSVPLFERIADAQLLLLEHEEQLANDELDRLIETLGARLGRQSIVQQQAVESHLPERSYRNVEAGSGVDCTIRPKLRPLRLLAMPLDIAAIVSPSHDDDGKPISFTHQEQVHRLHYADGPERIAGLWWEGRNKTRDYFDVEDELGRRFWLFRVIETKRWYLHGIFG
jgi:protein ImuB